MKYAKVAGNCLIVAFVALLLDGCLHRDPYVQLPHGYHIVAISPGSPCCLGYDSTHDDRQYTDWWAGRVLVQEDDRQRYEIFWLRNRVTDETLEFESEHEWEAACRARNAVPATLQGREHCGITGFARNGPIIVAAYDNGYFILDTAENAITTFSSEQAWTDAAAAAGLATNSLTNPKSRFVQTREPLALAIIGGLILLTLPWVFRPLWSRSERQRQNVE